MSKTTQHGDLFPSLTELTEAQKQKILDTWNTRPDNPPSLKELSIIVFEEELDARSSRGKAVRQFLATRNLKATPYATAIILKQRLRLKNEQKEFIKNNISTMNSLEIARILFNNPHLVNLSGEVVLVNEYANSIIAPEKRKEDLTTIEWKPPAKISELLVRLNRYAAKDYDVANLKPVEKKNFTVLISYLKTYRFRQQISTYSSIQDQELFESEFIRCTYDKPDLSSEEIDQYVIYSGEVVISRNILRSIELFQKEQEVNLESNEKLNMGLVEATSSLRKEYNDCVTRQQKLLNMLTQKRSDRLDSQIQANASILSIIEEWRTYEGRQKLLKIAEMRKRLVGDEFDRLEGLSDLKVRLIGVDKSMVLNS